MLLSSQRIVVVASTAHTFGKVDVNDLHFKKGRWYSEWPAYGQSKLGERLSLYSWKLGWNPSVFGHQHLVGRGRHF